MSVERLSLPKTLVLLSSIIRPASGSKMAGLPWGLVSLILIAFCMGYPGNANADWRDEIGRFRIGLIADKSATSAVFEAEPFRLAVEEKLGLPVEIIPMADLARLAGAHMDGRVEYAIFPATTFAAAWVNCECIEPLVIAMAGDMTSVSHSVVIGRASSGVTSASSLAGKKVWLLTGEEAIAQQYAIHGLRAAGIKIGGEDVGFLTADDPRLALERFSNGEGDALIGWSSLQGDLSSGYSRGTLKQLAGLNEGNVSDLHVIWKSDPLPHRTHSIRKNLDGTAKRLLRELLADMFEADPVAYDSIEPVFGGGFKIARQSEFASAIKFARSLLPPTDDDGLKQEKSEQTSPEVRKEDAKKAADNNG